MIQDVLDKATTQARGFFEREKREIDTAIFPDLVRYYAKELLQAYQLAHEQLVEP